MRYLFALVFLFFVQDMSATKYICNRKGLCGCSRQPVTTARIIGGEPALQDTWSWTISLRDGNNHFCGGSILNEQYIITAAHCLVKINGLSSITVCAGTNRLSDTCRQRREIQHIINHPSYDNKTYENDIALIQVKVPFDFTDKSIARICLPNTTHYDQYPKTGTDVIAVGWGINEAGQQSDTLKQVTIQVVDEFTNTCDDVLKNYLVQLCAAAPGKDTCQGDSGGPLMVFTDSKQWELVGITSYGYGCATEHPGVYTRITVFLTWIQQFVQGGGNDGRKIHWNGNNWAHACDFHERNLDNVKTARELCGTKCAQTERCTHFAWTHYNGGTCWMKTGDVSKSDAFSTHDQTMICGVVDPSLNGATDSTIHWNGNNWAHACDFHERNLDNVKIAPELCGPKCARTKRCTHFTWTRYNGGTCWMKTGDVSKSDAFSTNDQTMVCGVVDPNSNGGTGSTIHWNGNHWAHACDFHERNLDNVKIAPELCGPKCARTTRCTHFTWTRYNGGTCWMKTGAVSKSDAFSTNDQTMVCGVVDPNSNGGTGSTIHWNGNNWAHACDFHERNLDNVKIVPELCGPKCAQTKRCTHFTWTRYNGGTCWMKTGAVSKSDAFSTHDQTMVCGVVISA